MLNKLPGAKKGSGSKLIIRILFVAGVFYLYGCNSHPKQVSQHSSGKDTIKSGFRADSSVNQKDSNEIIRFYKNGTVEGIDHILDHDSLLYGIKFNEVRKECNKTGLLESEDYFDCGAHVMMCDYYSNGKIKKTIAALDLYGKAISAREYSENGQLIHSDTVQYPNKYVDVLEFQGTRETKAEHPYLEINKIYSKSGLLTQVQVIDGLPNETTIPNYNARIVHEENYKNGKISAMGDYVTNDIEGDRDSIGTWKLFNDSKLVRTLKFPSFGCDDTK